MIVLIVNDRLWWRRSESSLARYFEVRPSESDVGVQRCVYELGFDKGHMDCLGGKGSTANSGNGGKGSII